MINLNELLELPGIEGNFGKTCDKNIPLSISTDTRSIRPGQTFLALEGEKFKPMEFLDQLKEIPIVIYEKNSHNDALAEKAGNSHYFVAVKDSLKFLQDLGALVARKFVSKGGKLIAISGSNGKTTTKEMLFHLLKSFEPATVCTQKNNNNHIGVPLTLFQITPKTKFCALELGSNHPGEIELLCQMASPNVGVVTNIGDTHLEFFGTQEKVFKEEGHLYHAVDKSPCETKLFFLNKDDDFLKRLPKKSHVFSYGSGAENDARISARFNKSFLRLEDRELLLENDHVTGEHNFLNLSVAFIIAWKLLNVEEKALADKAAEFKPTSNRSEWIKWKGATVFLDAYNANPSSMKAAIKAFQQHVLEEKSSLNAAALVLGDMNELGAKAAQYHQELGRYCAELGFTNLIFVGRHAKDYNVGCNGIGKEFSSSAPLKKALGEEEKLLNQKWLFIKGSRSLQLESIVDIS